MTNTERIQANNAELREAIEMAESLPDAGQGGISFTTDETLSFENGVLRVNTADAAESDNTLPITSAAVAETVGNIEILLKTI